MPLKVFCCCTYRTSGRDWTKRDWAACWFIKALKNKPINGYAHVPLPGDQRGFLDNSTAAHAPTWFADIATARIRWKEVGAVALVPIPDSRSGLEDAVAPRTLGMATALAARLGSQAIVADILRWSQAMPSAHQAGGTRDPASLYQKARLSGIVPRDRRLMLIDDVLASGGHLRATAAFLTDHGALVAGAICAGRADDGVLGDDAFAVRVEVLPDFKYSCE